jgi:hypothetical protein
MYRRDHHLTARSPLRGNISRPALRWSYPLGGSENECFPVSATDGRQDVLFAFGGCVVRTDGAGSIIWKSQACGINAIGAVEDLDGDGRPEIVCGTGYDVIVLAAESGHMLFRHYVGFPASSGTPANIVLCHRFDRNARGMHLIVPLMSAKEVLVFDFRGGRGEGRLAHTLWMDDAFHPTIAAADMDNDGVDELVVSKLCALYVFDVLSGRMKQSVRWTSSNERHRNYGLLQLVDLDGDGSREVVIVAERVARHIAVIDNDGKGGLTPLWDRFVEFIYPDDTTELRHTGNSVADVDGDGKPELVVSVYNARHDGRWWLEILDPLNGNLKHEIPDRYLWGVQDIDGDGLPELLLSDERDRNPLPFSHVEVVAVRSLKPRLLWSLANARFAGKSIRPAGWHSNFRPLQFGHDETWTETRNQTTTIFLFARGREKMRSLVEATWTKGGMVLRTLALDFTGECLLTALADVNGDGEAECIISRDDGKILVARASRGVISSWQVGFRLQVEGYSAARPGPVPVVYRPAEAGRPLVCIPDNRDVLHQVHVDASGKRAVLQWTRPGRGWVGYDRSYHSAYVRKVDGVCEVMAVNPERRDCSELVAFAGDGTQTRSWLFPDFPPPGSPRIGLYEWVVAGEEGRAGIVASSFASPSMNSEETIALGMDGMKQWHKKEYGEGEWGRGVGPWSAFALLEFPDHEPEVLFLAKDHLCCVDAQSGEWVREPMILWRATNSTMNQPDWDFTKDRQADFGTEKDPFTAYGSPILVDVDGDGKREILVAGCFGGFGVLRYDFSLLWWKRTPFTDMMLRLPGIADVYGNGTLCIGICRGTGVFACLEAATGKELWTIDLHSTTADIASCDIDGDGREEFIAGTTDGRLLALGIDAGGAGVIKWSMEFGYSLGNPVIADADGDGLPEVLVVSGEGTLVCIGEES